MSQFTVNDRVRIIKNGAGVDEGETGVIISVVQGAAYAMYVVLLDSPGVSFVLYHDELELEIPSLGTASSVVDADAAEVEARTVAALVEEEVDIMAITRSFCR